MTYSRAAELGYAVDDVCPLCGAIGDTLRHRIWYCDHPDAVRARNQVAPEWIQREQSRRPASDVLWLTGWIPHPADVWPAPADTPEAHVLYGESAEGDEPPPAEEPRGFHGRLYGDGSCTTHVFPELRRAGSSVVQREHGSSVVRRVRCPVASPLPQTPQAAEYMVVALTQQLARKGKQIDLAVDCLNVVRDLNAPYAVAASARKVQAGISRVALADGAWTSVARVRKVKAHVNPDTAPTQAEKEDARGNNWADVEAKAAVLLHPQPSPAAAADLEAALKRSKIIVRTIAKVSQAFPPMPKDRMVKPPMGVEGATVKTEGGHDWAFASGFWRCRCCLRLTLEPHLTRQLVLQKCTGPKLSVQVETMANLGHALARTADELPIVFCLRCGAFTTRRAYGLAAPCKGKPSPPGAQALARIRRGLQPWQYGNARRQRSHVDTEAWSGIGGGFIRSGPRQGDRRKRGAQPVDTGPRTSARTSEDATMEERNDDLMDGRDEAVQRGEQQGPRAVGEVGVDIARGIDAREDENEDPFGHGGSLDEDGGGADTSLAPRPVPGSGVAATSADRHNVHNVSGARCAVDRERGHGGAKRRHSEADGDSGTAGQPSSSSSRQPRHAYEAAAGPSVALGVPSSVWTDPPAWLYLPHLHPPRAVVAQAVPTMQHQADEHGADAPAAHDYRAMKRARRWNASRAREETDDYVLQAAFEDQRIRAERKRAANPEGTGHTSPSASQRLEAIRRRIRERAENQEVPARRANGVLEHCDHGQCELSTVADAVNETGRPSDSSAMTAQGEVIKVQARTTVESGASTREGPGDPSARGSTAAAAEHRNAPAAAAVARADIAATPHLRSIARLVLTRRGKAALGPPEGAAAPSEDLGMVAENSMGRDSDDSLHNKPHARSGGGPRAGHFPTSPLATPEARLGVGPSGGRHLRDGDGHPTQLGERRGGGSVLASPRPLPQQRVAAAPQLGAATDSSPKGVESATTPALASECSDIPEQLEHRTDGGQCTEDGVDEAGGGFLKQNGRAGIERHMRNDRMNQAPGGEWVVSPSGGPTEAFGEFRRDDRAVGEHGAPRNRGLHERGNRVADHLVRGAATVGSCGVAEGDLRSTSIGVRAIGGLEVVIAARECGRDGEPCSAGSVEDAGPGGGDWSPTLGPGQHRLDGPPDVAGDLLHRGRHIVGGAHRHEDQGLPRRDGGHIDRAPGVVPRPPLRHPPPGNRRQLCALLRGGSGSDIARREDAASGSSHALQTVGRRVKPPDGGLRSDGRAPAPPSPAMGASGFMAAQGHIAATEFTDRRQLVQRLRDGPSARSLSRAGADAAGEIVRDEGGRAKRPRLATRGGVRSDAPGTPKGRSDTGGVHAAGGGPSRAAVGEEIRGRGSSPGRAGVPPIRHYNDGNSAAAVRIRGPTSGLGPVGEEGALSSCLDHSVLRRPLPMPGEVLVGATVRGEASRRHSKDSRDVMSAFVERPADAEPAGGDSVPHPKTNEVAKIHRSSWGTQAGSGAGSSDVVSLSVEQVDLYTVAGEKGAVERRAVVAGDAGANAAANSAWHGRECCGGADVVAQP